MSRSWVTLIGALLALVAGLTAWALSRLRDPRDPWGFDVLGDLFGGSFGSLLISLAFWLAVGALLLIIATAVLSLASANSSIGRGEPRPVGIAPKVESPQPRERTTPPDKPPWIGLAEGCVELIDELDQNADGFDPLRRELADHVALRLEEVLERSGVEVIKDEATFDRARHRPVRGVGAASPGAIISETVSSGFAVGPRVLRRARVRVEGVTTDANR
jgi:hypothetical protein